GMGMVAGTDAGLGGQLGEACQALARFGNTCVNVVFVKVIADFDGRHAGFAAGLKQRLGRGAIRVGQSGWGSDYSDDEAGVFEGLGRFREVDGDVIWRDRISRADREVGAIEAGLLEEGNQSRHIERLQRLGEVDIAHWSSLAKGSNSSAP